MANISLKRLNKTFRNFNPEKINVNKVKKNNYILQKFNSYTFLKSDKNVVLKF